MSTTGRIVTLSSLAILGVAAALNATGGSEPRPSTTLTSGQSSAFIENRGQVDPSVRYYTRGSRYSFYLTDRAIVMSFLRDGRAADTASSEGHALALRFIGGRVTRVLPGTRAAGAINYLHGSNPDGWRTNLSQYTDVVYSNVWPGIDLHVREQAGTLKYEFHVDVGANPTAVKLAYDGATSLALDAAGNLAIGTTLGTLHDAAPVSYQTIDGHRVAVASRYTLGTARNHEFGFEIGSYRRDQPLVIDPGIAFATFLGGSSHEMPGGTAVDAAGNLYIVGYTQSPDFPTTTGAFRRTGAQSNFSDVFVTKLNPGGTARVYSTFIGGSDFDFGRRIAVDGAGNAYITGQTKSRDYPTTGGAFDRSFNVANCPRCGVDQYDSFVTKLNASGSALVYSTFLGGTDIDSARGIAVDGSGNAYVTGETTSRDFPTTAGALQRTFQGAYDVFVTKLNATGSALVYSTFLAGTNVDNGERIAVDNAGRAYVMGFTSSTDFPTTPGAFSRFSNGGFDVFVTKLNGTGSGIEYSTLLGGQGMEVGGGLAIDAAGNAYVSGGTGSTDFPTTAGAFDAISDGSDAFVTKLNPTGSALVYSTVVGGSSGEGATGISVDGAGDAWITGGTSSSDFPVTGNAAHAQFSGVSDAFLAEINATGAALLYSTYIGGSSSDVGDDIITHPNNAVFVAGHTYSLDFPATVGAIDTIFNGDTSIFWGDAFVVKIATNTDVSTPTAPAAVPAAPTLVSPANGDTPPQPITFDWNDAAAAASYTIQIDDSNTFTAPLIRNADVTTSMYATTGLSTSTHFWRVRGVNVDGVAGPWSAVRSFTPQTPPPPATLSTMSTNPSSVVGGTASSGTIVMSVGAPDGGAVVSLSSSHPTIASVPATVSVPANSFTGTFIINTTAVTTNTLVTITASYNGATRTATLNVTTGATGTTLQALMLVPSEVTGGSATQGVVRLESGAPSGGAVVSLSSTNPAIASVPATVTVSAGSTTAVFNVSTSAVSSSTAVTISGTYGSTTLTANLTVNAAAPPPPPPQTATVSLTVSGRSGIRVSSTPTGLNVASGSNGSASFTLGSSITLSVSGGRDAVFSGACSTRDKAKSCTFTLSGPATVSANVQ